jgi:tetratricopeptide (TPR) repeat protein
MAEDQTDTAGPVAAAAETCAPPNSPPGYELIEEIGRGGMGVVYRARDTALDRDVAVKLLAHRVPADSPAAQRFLSEARITGQLQHPGIPAVHQVGTLPDGRPFLAMKLIRGTTLADILKQQTDPAANRSQLLGTFEAVCQAVGYAHSYRVVHRDLKPANIMVGRFGEVQVMDWGLAKVLGEEMPALTEALATEATRAWTEFSPTPETGSHTQAGSMVGTPAYIAPEQAAGELAKVDERADVFGLGALLAVIITGQPPYVGESFESLRVQAVRGKLEDCFARLDASGAEPELVALCKRCLAFEPVDRPANAGAVATAVAGLRAAADERARRAELERVRVEGEQATALARSAERRKRRRLVVGAAAVLALAAVGGLVAVLAVQRQANAVQRQANADLAAKNQELAAEQAKVQARFDMAVKAIETFHTGVSEDFLLREERFKSVRDWLLKAANDFYAQLAALLSKESDPASRRALGQANFAAAQLTTKVGQKETALAAHQQVLKYREFLAAEPGAGPVLKIDAGRSLTAVASLLCLTGQTDLGLAAYHRAEAVLAEAAPSDPAAVQDALAECRVGHGNSLAIAGRNDDALAVLRRARAGLEARAAVQGLSTEAQVELARAVRLIATILTQIGHYAEAEVELRTALAMQQKLADDSRAIASRLSDLAQSHGARAGVLETLGRPHEALAEYREALLVQQKLTKVQPAVTHFRLFQAWFHSGIGKLLGASGHPSEGFAELRQALAIQQRLADEQPAYTQCRESLASTHHLIGIRFAREGQPAPALESYRAEFAILEELMKQQPDNPGHRERFANAANDAAGALTELGRTREARALCERALAMNEALLRADAKTVRHSTQLAESLMRMGQVRRAEGDLKGAASDWHRAVAMYAAGAAEPETSVLDACCHAGIAGLGGVAGSGVSVAQSVAETMTAIAKLRQAAKLGMRDLAWLRTDPSFGPLRGKRDFEALLKDLAKADDPFAPAR